MRDPRLPCPGGTEPRTLGQPAPAWTALGCCGRDIDQNVDLIVRNPFEPPFPSADRDGNRKPALQGQPSWEPTLG